MECIIVGGGVVGLAVARSLAMAGREVLLLEAGEAMGTQVSARSSEVIHAGLYDPPGSLKARLCVAGRKALYAYCESRGVACRRLEKLMVATSEAELPMLAEMLHCGLSCGAGHLRILDKAEIRDLEPALHCAGAMLSPETGIVDSGALMLALQADLEESGGTVALLSPLEEVRVSPDGLIARIGGAGAMDIKTRLLINCAGLNAVSVAQMVRGGPDWDIPANDYVKGNYFSMPGRAPFSRLIYPLPERDGLGIHLTLNMSGQARFGPDMEPVEKIDFRVDPARADAFAQSVQRWWPDLPADSLSPDYANIRPRVRDSSGELMADFQIIGPRTHGCPGVIHLMGIESPGLTASLALGDEVACMVAGGAAGVLEKA